MLGVQLKYLEGLVNGRFQKKCLVAIWLLNGYFVYATLETGAFLQL